MYELRNIKLGSRPVTGQNYRDNIQQFMKKHLTVPNEASGKENVPANVDSVEEHRPNAVVVEVSFSGTVYYSVYTICVVYMRPHELHLVFHCYWQTVLARDFSLLFF